jgi:hypothetical protein
MSDISGRRNQDQYMLRLPDGMRERLHHAAKSNARSLNSEIVARLDASFDARRSLAPEVAKFLDDYVDQKVAERLSQIARQIGGDNG